MRTKGSRKVKKVNYCQVNPRSARTRKSSKYFYLNGEVEGLRCFLTVVSSAMLASVRQSSSVHKDHSSMTKRKMRILERNDGMLMELMQIQMKQAIQVSNSISFNISVQNSLESYNKA